MSRNSTLAHTECLFSWGVFPSSDMHFAEEFTCPHCRKFSYFCLGEFHRHAATHWRRAVIGFVPEAKEESVGVAVLQCSVPTCKERFKFRVHREVFGAYVESHLGWGMTQVQLEFVLAPRG